MPRFVSRTLVRTFSALALALLLIAPLAAATDAPQRSRLVNGPAVPSQDIFTVEFVRIDGERIQPRQMLTLDPGQYTLTVRIPAHYTQPAHGQRLARRDLDVEVEIDVAEGQDYRIRGQWNRGSLAEPWALLIDDASTPANPH